MRESGGWAPWSPCGNECLPVDAAGAPWRVGRRLVALAVLIVLAVGAAPALALVSPTTRGTAVRRLFRAVLRAAGVSVSVRGDDRFAVDGGATGVLVVANHMSWIDVLALGAVQPVRMIAKAEIRAWPVVGSIAARTGALFVDRSGLRALPGVVADTAAALRSGAAVGVFPEGTTWCGAASGPFRRAVFQAAVDSGTPVRPVALALRLPGGAPTTAAAFVGETTLLDSLRRVLALDGVVCEVTVLPALSVLPGEDRRSLARRAELAVTGAVHPDAAAQPAAAVQSDAAAHPDDAVQPDAAAQPDVAGARTGADAVAQAVPSAVAA